MRRAGKGPAASPRTFSLAFGAWALAAAGFSGAAPVHATGTVEEPLPVDGHALKLDGAHPAPLSADESTLVTALNDVHENHLDEALKRVETLVHRNPKFRLAQLVYGDLLLAKSQVISTFGDFPAAPAGRIRDLRDEARKRLHFYLTPHPKNWVPEELLRLAPEQHRALVVDQAASRLYVFDNHGGVPRLLTDFYVSTGKNGAVKVSEGDQRTPVGVYFIVTRLPASALPDMYGAGAFPINYPNEWDRRLGRTGYGIWIHGVPTDTYSRPPRASDGCMAVSNDDLEALWKLVNAGTTPVVIANGIHWQPLKEVESRGRNLMRQVQAWRRDWESLDVRRYSRHYAKDFRGEGMAREQWMRYKRRVNDAKRWVRIGLSDVSMFAYPGERDLVVVDFDQNYRSSNFSNRLRKRQYWREAGGVWRIVYEGSAEMRPQDFQGIPFSARTRLSRNENN